MGLKASTWRRVRRFSQFDRWWPRLQPRRPLWAAGITFPSHMLTNSWVAFFLAKDRLRAPVGALSVVISPLSPMEQAVARAAGVPQALLRPLPCYGAVAQVVGETRGHRASSTECDPLPIAMPSEEVSLSTAERPGRRPPCTHSMAQITGAERIRGREGRRAEERGVRAGGSSTPCAVVPSGRCSLIA